MNADRLNELIDSLYYSAWLLGILESGHTAANLDVVALLVEVYSIAR